LQIVICGLTGKVWINIPHSWVWVWGSGRHFQPPHASTLDALDVPPVSCEHPDPIAGLVEFLHSWSFALATSTQGKKRRTRKKSLCLFAVSDAGFPHQDAWFLFVSFFKPGWNETGGERGNNEQKGRKGRTPLWPTPTPTYTPTHLRTHTHARPLICQFPFKTCNKALPPYQDLDTLDPKMVGRLPAGAGILFHCQIWFKKIGRAWNSKDRCLL